jgi:sulfide:quinone oxidoreductase
MKPLKQLTPTLSVTGEVGPYDLGTLEGLGIKAVINNRPDHEEPGQATSADIAAEAKLHKMTYLYIPVVSGQITQENIDGFGRVLDQLPGPAVAFCRSGTRSATLWALSQAGKMDIDAILKTTAVAGYDLSSLRPDLEKRSGTKSKVVTLGKTFNVVIVGGGAAGCATAASLLKRQPKISVAIIEPSEQHYYQPGWTMVGGGVFTASDTVHGMRNCIPEGVEWIKGEVAGFEPDQNQVTLEDGTQIGYHMLVVCPGLKLDWDAVEGLSETLGANGVTSNYRFDLAPYTWELVENMQSGTAIFTQPLMPIKCAGAPQKAVYLSSHHWEGQGLLGAINVEFNNANGALFGVKEFVPPLMQYIKRYNVALNLNSNLKKVNGANKTAWFDVKQPDGSVKTVEKNFDMLHVVPPQCAPDFIKSSPLANAAGWVDVNQETLQHTRYKNIFSLGDVCSTPNAKTAAAVRKQAPIVAENILCAMEGMSLHAWYDGYGACPLTVERGKVILAEFGYNGKLLPTFPLDGTKPRRSAWWLKTSLLPKVYWEYMLRGKETLAKPAIRTSEAAKQKKAA